MARRPRQWWWRSCQAKAPENIPRRPAIRVSRLGTKPAHVPFQRVETIAGAELIPGLLAEVAISRFGLALDWSRLRRRRRRRYPASTKRRKHLLAADNDRLFPLPAGHTRRPATSPPTP